MTTTEGATAGTLVLSDLDIMVLIESVLQNDEIVHVLDVHRVAIAIRDRYEQELAEAQRLREGVAALTTERDDLAARVNDGEAVQMLRWIVDAYHPQWHYEMGKTGYECAFCKRMFKTSKEFQEIADHKLGCQWSQTKAWLATQGTGEGDNDNSC